MENGTILANFENQELSVDQVPQLRDEIEKAKRFGVIGTVKSKDIVVLQGDSLRVRIGQIAVFHVLTEFLRRARAVQKLRAVFSTASPTLFGVHRLSNVPLDVPVFINLEESVLAVDLSFDRILIILVQFVADAIAAVRKALGFRVRLAVAAFLVLITLAISSRCGGNSNLATFENRPQFRRGRLKWFGDGFACSEPPLHRKGLFVAGRGRHG